MRKFAIQAVRQSFSISAVILVFCSLTMAQRFSEWTVPVNLGSIINTTVEDAGPCISRDGLSLYFHSFDPRGFGGADLYVTHRASPDTAWQAPINLGGNVNTSSNENACALSADEHRLYFQSNRPGGEGGIDLYVIRRRDKKSDNWEPPVNLGYPVNTASQDLYVGFYEDDATGLITLLFGRLAAGAPMSTLDILASALQPNDTWGIPLAVAELNSDYIDIQPSVRRDGLEVFFASNRPGTTGVMDLWTSTRASTFDLWSTPINLGTTVNCSGCNQGHPAISADGKSLFFYSNRPGGYGGLDLWVTTRTKLTANGD